MQNEQTSVRRKIKGVLFDMDGTMFDTETMSIYGWEVTAPKYGIEISRDFMISCMGLVTSAIRDRFYEQYGREFDYDNFRADKLKAMEEVIVRDGVPHKKGLINLLEFLKSENIKCAVATSTTYSRAVFNIERGGVLDYFDEIISGDMVEHGKPEPDIYIRAAQKLGLDTESCMVLEDSRNGILSAHASGTVSVLIPDIIPVDADMLSAADYKLPDLDAVIELIKQLNK